MNPLTFAGERIRLAALDVENDAETLSRWSSNTEYSRLLDSVPAQPLPPSRARELFAQEENRSESFFFCIRTLTGDRLIGFISLDGIEWQHGSAFVGIGIGEPDLWGKGYGSEAMRLVLRYAFDYLHLERVGLDVFEYNQRAFRSYLKVGFVEEGRLRQFLNRDGRRWDLIYMGILREEWEARQS